MQVPTKKGARVEWFKGTVLKTNFNATDKTFEVTVKFDADDQKEVGALPAFTSNFVSRLCAVGLIV